jgi:DNA repair protein RecO (recombination protein O)
LPAFLSAGAAPSLPDVLDGFRLTGYFLNRHVFEPRGLSIPDARDTMIRYLAQRPH